MNKVILTSAALFKLIETLKKEIGFNESKPRFRKIEKINEKTYVVTLHTKNGKYNVLLDIGKMLFTYGKFKVENSYDDKLTIFLNKKIKNSVISSFFQYDLDRLIVFEINNDNGLRIIFELFGGGNFIITKLNGEIIDAYREFETKRRIVKRGEIYSFPEDRFQRLMEIVKENGRVSKRDIFRYSPFDPVTLNFLIKDRDEFDSDSVNLLYKKGRELIEKSLENSCFYLLEENDKLYIHPYPIQGYEGIRELCGVEKITEFLINAIFSPEGTTENRLLKEKEKLEKRIKELVEEKEEVIEILNDMYTYIPQLSIAFEKLKGGMEIDEIGPYKIVKIDRKNRTIDLRREGRIIKLRYDMNPFSSISYAYDKIKSYEDAIENLKKKIEELDVMIHEEKERHKMKKITERRTLPKKWYERFIWSISTNGFLIVAGRDATTNEILIKKYMEEQDLVLHSEIHGSPFTLLKDGINAKQEDIYDAALITASYSKAWKIGISTVPVYYVTPEQVSKKAPSGEYMKKGSFMIYGKKNYIRGLLLELFIGIISREGVRKILVSSKNSVLNNSIKNQKKIFRLTQGKTPKSKVVNKIVTELVEQNLLDREYKEEYINDLMNRLPSGYYRIESINRSLLEKT